MDAGDDSLVADFMARRPAGLSDAYERYARDLFAVARHVLGDSQEAEDCIHDALLRVWRTPNSFRPERGTLRAFLIGCVRNEALSRLRSDARRVAREKKGYLQEMPLDAVPSDDPLEAARVRAALSSLPAEQRVTIQQAFFEDLSQRQIAEKLGLPLGTVKSRMLLGMRKLRAQLREVAP